MLPISTLGVAIYLLWPVHPVVSFAPVNGGLSDCPILRPFEHNVLHITAKHLDRTKSRKSADFQKSLCVPLAAGPCFAHHSALQFLDLRVSTARFARHTRKGRGEEQMRDRDRDGVSSTIGILQMHDA